ncbi:MAG TPA: DNA polymerase III subunit delta' [Terriglobales bacterium]|nr:DNA polymerase III subunit delta' [Terriglobales bacterium]
MSFTHFLGNRDVVTRLRDMLAQKRLPHAIILAGPQGAGKYLLAQMLAKGLNCLAPPRNGGPPDFCGACSNCVRIAAADDLEARFTEALEAREALRDADKRDTRLLIQTHPDVLVIPPDPPQMMIKLGQVRRVIETIYFRPGEGRERVYIFTNSAFMKEAANSLLKVLEEPPEFATILLLTENPGELLPTIRSRAMTMTLAALSPAEIEADLAQHRRELGSKQRSLVARLSGGAVGRARSFDLTSYTAARQDALTIVATAVDGHEHTDLFRVTEDYRAGHEGKEKTDDLLHTLYLLLQDLLYVKSGTPELVRNTDIVAELKRLAQAIDFAWLAQASQGLGEVQRGMRRNLLRSLSLDAFAASLERVSR